MQSKLGEEKLERCRAQGFGKHVSHLRVCAYVEKLHSVILNLFSNQVTIQLYVLCSLMEHNIFCHMNCRLIVTEDHCCLVVLCLKFCK